jgi:hypothetical protein
VIVVVANALVRHHTDGEGLVRTRHTGKVVRLHTADHQEHIGLRHPVVEPSRPHRASQSRVASVVPTPLLEASPGEVVLLVDLPLLFGDDVTSRRKKHSEARCELPSSSHPLNDFERCTAIRKAIRIVEQNGQGSPSVTSLLQERDEAGGTELLLQNKAGVTGDRSTVRPNPLAGQTLKMSLPFFQYNLPSLRILFGSGLV